MGYLSKLPAPLNQPWIVTLVGLLAAFAVYKVATRKEIGGGSSKKRDSEDLTSHFERETPMGSLPTFKTELPYRRGGGRRDSVAGESVNEEELTSTKKVVHPKSDEAKERIMQITGNNLLFRNLDRHQKQDIIDAMMERRVKTGEDVIKQGDEGDYFYVVDSGHFDILVNGSKVGESKAGGAFGELALLYLQPRAATVRATTDSVVWAVDRSTFRKIVLGSNARKRQLYQKFLRDVPILKNLTEEEIIKAADSLEPASFNPGDHIISEGDLGDTFYIIEEGTVSVVAKGEQVATKARGEYFGEIALLTDGFRVATVVAQTPVDCLVLDKNAFVRLLGPCIDILKRNMDTYKQFEARVNSS